MTAEQFAYWLQGRMEMLPNQMPTEEEWKMIKNHLDTVFVKVTSPLNQFPSVPFKFNPLVDDRTVAIC